MEPRNVFFPCVAGGFLDPGVTANGTVAPDVRGATVTKVSAGNWTGVLDEPVTRGSVRLWVSPSQNFPAGQCFIALVNATTFAITSFGLSVVAGALVETAADMVVSFGIEGIPER